MIYKFNQMENVTLIVAFPYKYEELLELKSVHSFCLKLNHLMNCDLDFHYYIFWGNIEVEYALLDETTSYKSYKKNVLFWIGDEKGCIPSCMVFERFKWIFKVHLRDKDAVKVENGINIYKKGLYHFPLLTVDDVPQLPILPFNRRKYNLYYCGNLNKNRFPLYTALKKKINIYEFLIKFFLSHNIKGGIRLFNHFFNEKEFDFSDVYENSYIHFYSGFNNGADYATYAKFLQNSRIVLSPCGFYSTECFRFYEAMRQGCIVITEKLPKTYFYKDSPCITIDSWDNLSSILNNKNLFKHFTPEAIEAFYNKRLSIAGIADYVSKILKGEFII